MTERSRPPGPETIAEEGLKLGARLVVGLLAVPLVGLSLLTRRNPQAQPEAAAPADAEPATPPSTDIAEEKPPPSPSATGPAAAEVEQALRRLAQATIGKSGQGKKKGGAKGDEAPSPRKHARKEPRKARTPRALPRPDARQSP